MFAMKSISLKVEKSKAILNTDNNGGVCFCVRLSNVVSQNSESRIQLGFLPTVNVEFLNFAGIFLLEIFVETNCIIAW